MELFPKSYIGNQSIEGIYILERKDKEGTRYACIDQVYDASGGQHIDAAICEYGIFHPSDNLYGWRGELKRYPHTRLDEYKSFFIKEYRNYGYIIV